MYVCVLVFVSLSFEIRKVKGKRYIDLRDSLVSDLVKWFCHEFHIRHLFCLHLNIHTRLYTFTVVTSFESLFSKTTKQQSTTQIHYDYYKHYSSKLHLSKRMSQQQQQKDQTVCTV